MAGLSLGLSRSGTPSAGTCSSGTGGIQGREPNVSLDAGTFQPGRSGWLVR